MRKIMASLDIGSYSLKLVVGELVKGKLNILACVDTPSRGIKKGYVINVESASECLQELFLKAEKMLGINIKQVILNVPSFFSNIFFNKVTIPVNCEDKIIKSGDIVNAMSKSVKDKIEDNSILITVQPSSFIINDEVVSTPLNMVSEKMTMKSVSVTIPKKNVVGISECLKKIGVEIVSISLTSLGDYYEFKNKELNKKIGAIVNIGSETTTVAIFNRGILTNLEVIDIGGANVTSDLMYVYKINNEDATYLKEHLALAHTRLAQPNESLTFKDKYDENVKINQYDASEVVMGRLIEIINLAKKQINLLTKKEISYIIFTGGVTETKDFDILLEELLGNIGIIGSVNEIGARDNKYTVSLGNIKHFNSILKIKGENYSILSQEDEDKFSDLGKKNNNSDNSILSKLFGYFFEN